MGRRTIDIFLESEINICITEIRFQIILKLKKRNRIITVQFYFNMFLHEFIFHPTDYLRNDIRENTKRKIYKDVNIFSKIIYFINIHFNNILNSMSFSIFGH